ncbi:unnamed protein product [Rotaria sp. Silwood2]|nr:unnamed protein product [Rotaria sp. Silwood2]
MNIVSVEKRFGIWKGFISRLYEYTLHAVCSPLHVIAPKATRNQLAAYVAELFNVDPEEHKEKYMRALEIDSWSVILCVDVKKARNLLGRDQNGLSDPYCEVRATHVHNDQDHSDELISSSSATSPSTSPSTSPNRLQREPSLLSSGSASCMLTSKKKLKSSTTKDSRRGTKSSSLRRTINRSSTVSSNDGEAHKGFIYCTEVQPKTTNPEWNEHFEFEIENIQEQRLLIRVFDSDHDHDQVSGFKTVVQEKRGVSRKLRGLQNFIRTGEIEDDFLGQSLATFDREQWFALTRSNQSRLNANKPRGEILLGLKVHFKLDDKNTKPRQGVSNDTVLELRRCQSSLSSANQMNSSIIVRPSIFRQNFRLSSMQPHVYAKWPILKDKLKANLSQGDSCLTTAVDSDLPLLIEEYHQLTRIVMQHELEDAREVSKNKESNDLIINWNGSINELSCSVLTQFRVLYNISILSEALIHLLVIMELRCSQDYESFISQSVIESYLKILVEQVRQRTDVSDLDFTVYEKTVFEEIFFSFIGHYRKRVRDDAPWFLPLKENLPNIQSIFEYVYI